MWLLDGTGTVIDWERADYNKNKPLRLKLSTVLFCFQRDCFFTGGKTSLTLALRCESSLATHQLSWWLRRVNRLTSGREWVLTSFSSVQLTTSSKQPHKLEYRFARVETVECPWCDNALQSWCDAAGQMRMFKIRGKICLTFIHWFECFVLCLLHMRLCCCCFYSTLR